MNFLSSSENSMTYLSVVLGPLFLVCFFILSAVLVVGIKASFNAISKKYALKKQPQKPKKPKVVRAKPIKSIEINPEEVDRISFKKT